LNVSELSAGDSVITYEGKKIAISAIEKTAKRTKVYNFEVEDFHTYYVSEQKVLVHNSLGPCDNKNLLNAAAKGDDKIWSSGGKGSVKNAYDHWRKHGSEFPEYTNAKQYVEGAKNFLKNSPDGTLTKTRANGDVLKYDPGTNTFAVMDASGAPRTMFRPNDGMQYWLQQ
jgi:pyocin large subunit-like protein